MEYYFIGSIIKENKALQKIQEIANNRIEENYMVKDLYTPFIYLGNLKEELANQFIRYLNPLLLTIIENNKTLKCTYTKFDYIKINDKDYFVIEYENNDLNEKIIPFIKKFGTDHIIDTYYKEDNLLYIPLIYSNNLHEYHNQLNEIYIPKYNEFSIQSLDIFKINKHNELTIVSSYPLHN